MATFSIQAFNNQERRATGTLSHSERIFFNSLSGAAATTTRTGDFTFDGDALTPAGTVSQVTGTNSAPTFTGTQVTPGGTISQPTFSGDSVTPAGNVSLNLTTTGVTGIATTQSDTNVSISGNVLTIDLSGNPTSVDIDITGVVSAVTNATATFTGTAFTPAGTVSTPTFAGTAFTPGGSVSAPTFTGGTPTFTGTAVTPAGDIDDNGVSYSTTLTGGDGDMGTLQDVLAANGFPVRVEVKLTTGTHVDEFVLQPGEVRVVNHPASSDSADTDVELTLPHTRGAIRDRDGEERLFALAFT